GIDPGLGTRFASTSRRSNLVGHRDMTLHRRSFLRLAGVAGAGSAFGICAPAIVRAATPIKLTLPWLPLGTYSFAFAATTLRYWGNRGLDVSVDRGFGSTKVCVPVDQGSVRLRPPRHGRNGGLRRPRSRPRGDRRHLAALAHRHLLAQGTQHHRAEAARGPVD